MSGYKVMVIVLDGGSFDVFYSLGKNGILPTTGQLMKKGSFGLLHSTIPPVSPVVTPSLLTGKNPGNHDMFGFGRFENGVFIPHTSKSIKAKTLWEILGDSGKKVVLLNVPWTFPPFRVNGVLISGFPSPNNRVESYPHEILSLLSPKLETIMQT